MTWAIAIHMAGGALLLGIFLGLFLSRMWLKETKNLASQLTDMTKITTDLLERLNKLPK